MWNNHISHIYQFYLNLKGEVHGKIFHKFIILNSNNFLFHVVIINSVSGYCTRHHGLTSQEVPDVQKRWTNSHVSLVNS